MKVIGRSVVAAVVLCTFMSSAVAPAFALGGCGRNGHLNRWGHCVWGGQNQNWCLRHTGHAATYVGGGIHKCL
jgi:hypothetical protein